MKKVNIKIKDIAKMEFEILEYANPGDYISLKGLTDEQSQIISSHIASAINNIDKVAKEKIYQQAISENTKSILESQEYNDLKLSNEKKLSAQKDDFYNKIIPNKIELAKKEWADKQENNLKLKEQEIKLKLQEELNNAKNNSINLQTKLTEKDQQIKTLNKLLEELKQSKRDEINDVKKHLELQAVDKLKNKEMQVRHELSQQLNDQEKEIVVLKNTNQNLDKNLHEKNKEIEALKNQINGLTIKRSSLGHIQAAGEDYETYIHSLLQNNFNFDEHINFYKATQTKNGIKPDIIIEFYDKKSYDRILIGKIVVEIKAKVSEKGSKKNEEFYSKLSKDTYNNDADYGILITELNPDEDIFIEMVQGHNNIYVVRDRSFITLVRMLRLLFETKAKVNVDLKDFKDKETIKLEFKKFFEEEVEKNFERLKDRLKVIGVAAEDIIKSARKIEEKMDEIERTSIKKMEAAFEKKFQKQDFLEKLDSLNRRKLENIKEIDPIED